MKTRTGFISNSSSSSFIGIGINLDYETRKDNKELQKYLEDNDYWTDAEYVCKVLDYVNGDYMEVNDTETFFEEFSTKYGNYFNEIQYMMKLFDLNNDEYIVNIYHGVVPS